MLTNILQYLEVTKDTHSDKVAFSDGKDSLTFAQLYAKSRSVGAHLARLGAYKRPIMVLMDKHPNTLTACFGAIYAGCFYAVIDSSMPEHRIGLIRDTLKADILIYDKKNARLATRLTESGVFAGEMILWDDICDVCLTESDISALDRVRARQIDTDPIYVVFTSGSTGVPKGVVAAHRSVIDYTESLCEAIGFDENTVFGNQTPLYFDAPLKEIMPTIKYGATAYLIPKVNFMFPVKLCEYLNEHKINTVCWVVSALTMISSLGALEKTPPRYLTTVCFGSEVFPRKQYELWREALPNARFFNLYGPTEATGMSTYWRADRELAQDEPIPVGVPFKNTDIILLADDKTAVTEIDVPGEICMRGTCVTLGYYNNPEKTAEAFILNPLNTAYPEYIYRTGDLGKYNAHGELVFISRRDAQIKHQGHRIELGEIEAVTQELDFVGRACCVYDSEGKRIVMYYSGECDEKSLSASLVKLLPRYMIPSEIIKMDRLPLTPNGKMDRRLLLEMAIGRK